MGLVTRPTKTGGFTTYVEEVANGNTTILASEVDADLNAIITGGVNNIETANINSAGLDTAAFADNSITTDKIANDAVTTDQIADDAVTTDQIADDAVDTDQIADEAVTTDKIAIGDSVVSFVGAAVTTGLNFSTVETTVVTLPAITTRGYIPEIFGFWGIYVALTSAGSQSYTVRVKRDAVTIFTTIVQVIGSAAGIRVPIPTPHILDALIVGTPGSYVYTITLQSSDSSVAFLSDGASAGSIFARELA